MAHFASQMPDPQSRATSKSKPQRGIATKRQKSQKTFDFLVPFCGYSFFNCECAKQLCGVQAAHSPQPPVFQRLQQMVPKVPKAESNGAALTVRASAKNSLWKEE
jgi:hypothetical protein